MKLFSTFGMLYCLVVRTIMSAVLFVVINCSSSFSAEKAENGEISTQKNLARVAVCVCMCVSVGGNKVCVTCCGACLWPRALIMIFL